MLIRVLKYDKCMYIHVVEINFKNICKLELKTVAIGTATLISKLKLEIKLIAKFTKFDIQYWKLLDQSTRIN